MNLQTILMTKINILLLKNLKLKDTTLLVTTHKNELISEFDNTFEVKEKNIKKLMR